MHCIVLVVVHARILLIIVYLAAVVVTSKSKVGTRSGSRLIDYTNDEAGSDEDKRVCVSYSTTVC